MTVSLWQADNTQPVQDVDFLIVGAGLIGTTAAFFAAQAGREVTITDSGDLALGASSRNAGFMITGLDTYYHHAIERYGHDNVRELWALSKTTHGHWRHFIQNGDVQVDWCGSTILAETQAEAQDLEKAAELMNADGIPVEFVNGDPFGRGYFAAIRQPQDAAIQPYQLVQAIFQQSGANLITNNEAYGIETNPDDTVTVYTRKFRFRAHHVLLCTNAYSPRFHPYFIGKVIPNRAQVLMTAPTGMPPLLNTCGYSDYGFMYYRDTFDGRLLIGGGRKQNKAEEHDTTDDRTTHGVQNVLEQYLKDYFPEVAHLPVERRWSGIMGFSVDGIPLVGRLPGHPRVGFAVGFTGHGLAMGAGSAERAVDLLLHDKNPGVVSASRL
jgi:gamma-glutamylputrescine oxidase